LTMLDPMEDYEQKGMEKVIRKYVKERKDIYGLKKGTTVGVEFDRRIGQNDNLKENRSVDTETKQEVMDGLQDLLKGLDQKVGESESAILDVLEDSHLISNIGKAVGYITHTEKKARKKKSNPQVPIGRVTGRYQKLLQKQNC